MPFDKKKRSDADMEAARLLMDMARTETEAVRRARDVEWRVHLALWAILAVAAAVLLNAYPVDRILFFRSGALWTVPAFILILHGLWLLQSHAEQRSGCDEARRLMKKASDRVKDLDLLGSKGRLDMPGRPGALALALPLCVSLGLSAGSLWLVQSKISALDDANLRFEKLSRRVDEICEPVDYLEGLSPILYAYQAPVVDPASEATALFERYFEMSRTGALLPTVPAPTA